MAKVRCETASTDIKLIVELFSLFSAKEVRIRSFTLSERSLDVMRRHEFPNLSKILYDVRRTTGKSLADMIDCVTYVIRVGIITCLNTLIAMLNILCFII